MYTGKNIGTQVRQLRAEGKTHKEIMSLLGCCRSATYYHCDENSKEKSLISTKKHRNKAHPFLDKTQRFLSKKKRVGIPIDKYQDKLILVIYHKHRSFHQCRKTKKTMESSFTPEDVIKKFGNNTICYLTGRAIDITKGRSYNFDHKIPVSRGGDNSIDNLGICTKQVNMAKSDLTPEEFFSLCKEVLEYNGYKVEKEKSE